MRADCFSNCGFGTRSGRNASIKPELRERIKQRARTEGLEYHAGGAALAHFMQQRRIAVADEHGDGNLAVPVAVADVVDHRQVVLIVSALAEIERDDGTLEGLVAHHTPRDGGAAGFVNVSHMESACR